MKARHVHVLFLLPLAVVTFFLPLRSVRAQSGPQFGDPLPGLADPVLSAFTAGRERFMTEDAPETGLGPVYNGRSCVECHSNPAPGGSANSLDNRVVRFGRQVDGMGFDPLAALGGPNLQRFGIADEVRGCQLTGEVVPQAANVVGLRQPPPLFGLGLIQAIPDSTLLANVRPEDANGIAGRPNVVGGMIGRFGWKATVPTILSFVGLALINELGVTNHLFPNELAPQGEPIPAGCDLVAELEDADASRLAGSLFFLTYLAAPPRGAITPQVLRGEAIFNQVGCALCHVPSMKTGPNAIEALNSKDVPLFSDLLTHYMGGVLDDHIPEGSVGGGRWRTAPLWGLSARKFFLHDGRTSNLVEAIALHGGEARAVRDRFFALPAQQRADLIAFLQSL